MRHRKIKGKLGRTASHRKAMLRNMTESIIEHGRIQTTLPKAKEVRKLVDYVITLAKRDDLHSRRLVIRVLPNKAIVAKLFREVAPRFQTRPGGFTRIYKMGNRKGDAAEMAVIELVSDEKAAE
ncbi:50S ribosomal protein L17 [bacterium]|nr:50S ribosomal protein L17 [candidate division CSSED10-310 bacterium]